MTMEILRDEVIDRSFWKFDGAVKYVDDWFLMRTPISLLLITAGYLVFTLKLGPNYMKNKRAFNVSTVLAFYNAAQVALSFYICCIGTKLIWDNGLIKPTCIMDSEDINLMITSITYIYVLAKTTELMDTIFFVFKKNYRQITFLHVYHHCAMLWSSWLTLKYEPTYDTIFLGTLNSFVHFVMYTYYGLSAFPALSKYLWWKKYITKMQIVQFMLVMLQAAVSYKYSECPPSYILLTNIFFNSLLFTGLFMNFYVNAYKRPKKIE